MAKKKGKNFVNPKVPSCTGIQGKNNYSCDKGNATAACVLST